MDNDNNTTRTAFLRPHRDERITKKVVMCRGAWAAVQINPAVSEYAPCPHCQAESVLTRAERPEMAVR